MMKKGWGAKGLLICIYIICFILLDYNSVKANQIYEASELLIGSKC